MMVTAADNISQIIDGKRVIVKNRNCLRRQAISKN